MVPGLTKFCPDILFSEIANKFYKTDVFNTSELIHIASMSASNVINLQLEDLRDW